MNYLGELSDKVSLQGGLRYNFYSLDARFDSLYFHFPVNETSINNDAMTGNLGVVYAPGAGWKMSANVSTGFRAPNAGDAGMVSASEPGTVIMPNSTMKAEYLYNLEGRIAKAFGDYLKADVSFYYTFLKDALVKHTLVAGEKDSLPAYYGTTQLQTMQNVAKVNIYGIQAGIDAMLPMGFGLSARVNYQDGKGEVLNNYSYTLDHVAPVFGKAAVSYSTHRLRVELYSYFSGRVSHRNLPAEELQREYLYAQDENGQPYSPAWCTINIQALYQITGFLSLSAGAENLADARYRPFSWGITAPGRNFIIALRASF
jgi:hemoglobin/transferrin/lactoferrin receptor protein